MPFSLHKPVLFNINICSLIALWSKHSHSSEILSPPALVLFKWLLTGYKPCISDKPEWDYKSIGFHQYIIFCGSSMFLLKLLPRCIHSERHIHINNSISNYFYYAHHFRNSKFSCFSILTFYI